METRGHRRMFIPNSINLKRKFDQPQGIHYATLDIFHIDNQVQNDNNTGFKIIDIEILYKKKH